MASNADDFARDLAKQEEAVRRTASELTRRIGQDLLRKLVDKTPVGRRELWKINEGRSKRNLRPKGYVGGHLRHNWQASVGAPTDTELEGRTTSGAAVFRREKGKIDSAPFGSIIYIQNPVPYAERVMEGGHSSQAPIGTFRVTVQEIAVGYNLQVTG